MELCHTAESPEKFPRYEINTEKDSMDNKKIWWNAHIEITLLTNVKERKEIITGKNA